MHVQFSGRYRLQVFHGDTDILLKDTGWFDNLITNNGLDLLGTGFTRACHVGSSTSAPTTADTSITDVLASTSSVVGVVAVHQVTTEPFYSSEQEAFTFAIGAVQGTIGQVAIGPSTTNLLSKARLAGVDGSPTTLTLSGIDRLVLTYEIRQYIRTTDANHSIDINGVTYNCLTRARVINTQSRWRPALGIGMAVGSDGAYYDELCYIYTGGTAPFVGAITTGGPSGTGVRASGGWRGTYAPGTYRIGLGATWTTATGDRLNITAATFGVSYGTTTNNGGAWQSSLEGPTLNKTQYQNLTLEYEVSWDRYTI